MKIRAERKPLADALAWVAQVIPRRPQAPALAGMKVATADGRLVLSASDYDNARTAALDVDVKLDGEALVSGLFLASIVNELRGDTVGLELAGPKLTITAGRSTYKAQVLRLEDYPTMPTFPKQVGTVHSDDLDLLISTVQAPIDDGSPWEQVKGLHLEGGKHELTAVGADNHRLSTAATSWTRDSDFTVSVPVKSVLGALKGLGSGQVEIGHDDSLLGLSCGDRTVTLRTLATTYADWRKLIRPPDEDAGSLEISAADLLGAIKRAAMVTDDEQLAMFVREEEVEVSARGVQGSGEGMEILEVESPISVAMGINARYMKDALDAVPSGDVRIGFSTGQRLKALMIRPLDHEQMTFVVMPKSIPGGME